MAVSVPVILALSLLISVYIYENPHLAGCLKTSFLIPMAIPVTSVVLMWRFLFDDNGIINGVLNACGMDTVNWMNTGAAFWILVLSYVWKNLGYNIILWLAALSAIMNDQAGGYARWALLPEDPTWESYKALFLYEPGFFVLFWNSIKICAGVLAGHAIFAVPCAYGFAMYEFKFKKTLFTIYIIFMMMPFQVLMLPEYMVLKNLGLINTLWAVILPGAFSTFPVFIMYNFFRGIPKSVIEAARMDGASEFAVFLKIGVPAGASGIAASMVLQFLEYWNAVEQPMIFLAKEETWPLSLYLPSAGMESLSVSLAAAFISLAPSLLIFRLGQDSLEAGISATTFKR